MVRFWSMGGILIVKGKINFITVMESGIDNITVISAGKTSNLVDLVEVDHNMKCITAIYEHEPELDYIVEWAKSLYHEYIQPEDKVVHTHYGVGKVEMFYKTQAYVDFNKVGKERRVSIWVIPENLTKMK